MSTFSDRIARRFQDAREYREEFEADVENGRRNMFGFRSQKWYEHQGQLRRKRHEDRYKRHHRHHSKDKVSNDDQDHSNDRDTHHDRDNPGDGDSKHDRSSQQANKSGRHGCNEDADDKDRGHGREHRCDRTRNKHSNIHGSSRDYQTSNDGGGRRKTHSKGLQKQQRSPGAMSTLFEVAGKLVEELLGGAPQQPIVYHGQHHRRRRKHRSKTSERSPAEPGQQRHSGSEPIKSEAQQHEQHDSGRSQDFPPALQPYEVPIRHPPPSQPSAFEREDRRHSRASNGAPLETTISHFGAPPGVPQSHGETESYYESRPLQNQRVSGGSSRGPPFHPQRKRQQRDLRPENPKALTRYHKNNPFGDREELYGDDSVRHKESRSPRGPEKSVNGVASSTKQGAPPAPPSTSSVRDFGRSLGIAESSLNTGTSASVDRDFDRDGQVDSSSITSRSSSMETEQPAHAHVHWKNSRNGNFEGGRGRHHEDADYAEYAAHTESGDMHVRGGGEGDDDEDEDSNASYNEYEKFDDEYLCDCLLKPGEYVCGFCRPEKDGANVAQQTPIGSPEDGQGRYRSLSYANAKLESERLKPYTYDDSEPRYRYSSHSYVDAKLKSEKFKSLSYDDLEPRYRYGSRSYVDAKARATGTEHTPYIHLDTVGGRYIPPLHDGAKAKRSESRYTPLGRTPRTYDASKDDRGERSSSPEPYKGRSNPGASQDFSTQRGRSRKPEPPRTRLKHVNFEDRSESPPPRPKRPPLRPNAPPSRPQRQEKYLAPGPIKEPPPNHYATLEISAPTTLEKFVAYRFMKPRLLTCEAVLQSLQRRCASRSIPTCLRGRSPGCQRRRRLPSTSTPKRSARLPKFFWILEW